MKNIIILFTIFLIVNCFAVEVSSLNQEVDLVENQGFQKDVNVSNIEQKVLGKQDDSDMNIKITPKMVAIGLVVTFVAGTAGFWRKFTWISDKTLKAKDWTVKKSKDLWLTLIDGRTIVLPEKEFRKLQEKVDRIEDIEKDIEEIGQEVQYIDTNRKERKKKYKTHLRKLAKEKYDDSTIIYDGDGVKDTVKCAPEHDDSSRLKTIINASAISPVFLTNLVVRPFTKKQFKYWVPFKKKTENE